MSDIKPLLIEVLQDGTYEILNPKDPRERLGAPVTATTTLTGRIVWTAAEFAAITPEAGKFYLVEA